jgi:hypothetical protein
LFDLKEVFMSRIIVGFSRNNSFFSKAIRFLTKSPCSHVYLKFEDLGMLGVDIICHASVLSVMASSYDNFAKHNTIVEERVVELTPGKYLRAIQDALSITGKRYDFLGILGFMLQLMMLRIGIKNPRRRLLDHSKSFFCSEFVQRVVKIEALTGKLEEEVSPEDLRQAMQGHELVK